MQGSFLASVSVCRCGGVLAPWRAPLPKSRRRTSGSSHSACRPAAAQETDQAESGRSNRVAWSARTAYKPKKLKPKRSLGQNFLQREEVLCSITETAGVQPGDWVLEIGPGTGALTRHLLRAGAAVTAVEKDDDLHERLQHEFAREIEDGKLRLIHADFLSLQLSDWLPAPQHGADAAAADQPDQPAAVGVRRRKVVANLPYNLTKSILRRLLPLGDDVGQLYLMVQDEVGRRLVAPPETGLDYRAMNVEVAFYSRPTYLFEVDRTAYFPAPNVDGAVMKFELRPRRRYPLQDDLRFLALVRLGFSERRKMLRNTLQSRFRPEDVAAALVASGLAATVRPQQLDLKQYVALWQNLPQDKAKALQGVPEDV